MTEIVIVGAGALGSYFAARLTDAGFDTVLVARPKRAAQLAVDGIRIASQDAASVTKVSVQPDCTGTYPAAFVIFCVKMTDLPSAFDLAQLAIGPDTVLVMVQNGVDAPGLAMARFPHCCVLAGRIHGFFEMDGPVVRHVGVQPSLVFGDIRNGEGDEEQRFADVLDHTGITARIAPSVETELWAKLLLASAFGGVGAATGLLAGEIRSNPEASALLKAAVSEVVDLARCKKVVLPDDIVSSTLAFISAFPHDANTSMKRDLEAGRRSEYESLTGAVLRMAQTEGLDVPAHQQIARLIRGRGLLGSERV